MDRAALLAFLRRHRLAVEATVAEDGSPQAAVVGFAVSDGLEIVFDTLEPTRKVRNLRREPRVALVVGWDDECTAQLEGPADEPSGADLDRLKAVYYAVFPDGRERATWPGLVYVRVRVEWARFSDYQGKEPVVVEFTKGDLRGPR